jgi:hypothetical protein
MLHYAASPTPSCSIYYKSTLFSDILKQIVYVLRTELNGNGGDKCCNRCCMFIITLTGLSPVALMNFNELIQDGILIQNGSRNDGIFTQFRFKNFRAENTAS